MIFFSLKVYSGNRGPRASFHCTDTRHSTARGIALYQTTTPVEPLPPPPTHDHQSQPPSTTPGTNASNDPVPIHIINKGKTPQQHPSPAVLHPYSDTVFAIG